MIGPGSTEIASAEPEAIVERRGRAGFICLNRPRALNALTLNMVRIIAKALDAFEVDPSVEFIVIKGVGDRAFCAGGDIRRLYEQGKAGDHKGQITFWREEYILNQRIKRFSKPYVALIDGIVMGGGVGMSLHGSYRVVSEKCVFAMPEVGIGFFPDVGATWLLPRVPHRLGVFLAVTGLRASAGDMKALGLATSFTTSARMPALEEALTAQNGSLDGILAAYASSAPESPLMKDAEDVAQAFQALESASIVEALASAASRGSDLARRALEAIAVKSPTSQAIALRQMRLGSDLDFEEAMRVEYRIVSRICLGDDFYEGVRATIVDKDNKPVWHPNTHSEFALESIDAYFAHLGDDELTFGPTAP